MLFSTLAASSLFVVAALGSPEPAPYKLGSMSLNRAFGLDKRQSGYQPTQTICGTGDTCAIACGATYETCASNDGNLHCFDPSVQQTCCPNLTGDACDLGYYCTADTLGATWCCPDGMDLAACAAVYSLTDALVSQVATSAPASSTPSSSPESTSVLTTSSVYTSSSVFTSVSQYTSSSVPTPTTTKAPPPPFTPPVSNGTAATTQSPVPFTGGANSPVAYGGLPALALAAGIAFGL